MHSVRDLKNRFVLASLVLTACAPVATAPPADQSAPPAGQVFFTAERLSSGAIRLALDNGSPEMIGYNLCHSQLQRRTAAGWTQVPSDEVCTMELRTLNPGHDATFEKRLPAGLPAGEYRYITNVESPLGTAQTGVATAPFRV
ncbi:MAG TPA: hypothetical protein VMS98_05145 [Thermoanaerobaculia bacterium]|nr:hypothetical protein [Thermoanaerobaculia bacterium]